jgi:mono/diheme cytochrome c family protein
MAVLVLTAVIVALGLGVLFLAMSGGPAGARRRVQRQSRRGRRLGVVGFLLAVLVFGLGIPAAVIATVKDRNDIPEVNVSDLSAQEKHGRELFAVRCANCHTLQAAHAVAQVGPSLDVRRPNKALVLDAINKGRAAGNGQMAAQLVEGQDARDVAAFVAKAVGQTGQK